MIIKILVSDINRSYKRYSFISNFVYEKKKKMILANINTESDFVTVLAININM